MGDPSYTIDVRSILEDLGSATELDAEVNLPPITLGEQDFAPVGPGRLRVSVTNTGAGVVVSGTLEVTLTAVCSRCLREFPLSVITPLEAFFVAPGEDRDLPEEQEVGIIHEGSVDLMEQILASLALELPFAPVHAEDCPGICPQCGADLVEGPCACEPDYSDSPFAALKDLLSPDEPC